VKGESPRKLTLYRPPRQSEHILQVTPGSSVTLVPSFNTPWPTTASGCLSLLASFASVSAARRACAARFEPNWTITPADSWPRHMAPQHDTRPILPVL